METIVFGLVGGRGSKFRFFFSLLLLSMMYEEVRPLIREYVYENTSGGFDDDIDCVIVSS